jgi:hypothetical protein
VFGGFADDAAPDEIRRFGVFGEQAPVMSSLAGLTPGVEEFPQGDLGWSMALLGVRGTTQGDPWRERNAVRTA